MTTPADVFRVVQEFNARQKSRGAEKVTVDKVDEVRCKRGVAAAARSSPPTQLTFSSLDSATRAWCWSTMASR